MYQGANYGRHTLLSPSFRNTGGMAAPSANPRGGVFGPQGYGGGIFDGMSGMGTAVGQNGEGSYPWMKHSDGTASLQYSANADFIMAGMPTIKEDGILGPQTCGALRYLEGREQSPGFFVPDTCQSFADYPESTVAPLTLPPTPGPSPAAPVLPSGETRARGSMMFGAVAAAVAVVGISGYMLTRKKRRR